MRRKLSEIKDSKQLVSEVPVAGARALVTVDVPGGSEEVRVPGVEGAIVRLRPGNACTDDDLRWMEDAVRNKGAVAVVRMPLRQHEALMAEQDWGGEERGLGIREAFEVSLRKLMAQEGCGAAEVEATFALAEGMLDRAGG